MGPLIITTYVTCGISLMEAGLRRAADEILGHVVEILREAASDQNIQPALQPL